MSKKITKLIAVYEDGSIGEVEPTPDADTQIIEVDERMGWLNGLVCPESPRATIGQLHVGNGVTLASDGFCIHLTCTPDYLEQFSGRGLKVRMIGDSAAEVQPVDSAISSVLAVYKKAEYQVWAGETRFVLLNPRYLLDALKAMEHCESVRIDFGKPQDSVLLSSKTHSALIKPMERPFQSNAQIWEDFAIFSKEECEAIE